MYSRVAQRKAWDVSEYDGLPGSYPSGSGTENEMSFLLLIYVINFHKPLRLGLSFIGQSQCHNLTHDYLFLKIAIQS